MKKNFMFGSVVVAVLLLGTGCGGGSSSNTEDTSTNNSNLSSNTDNSQKRGYYVDSAIEGASYKCVSSDGTTSSGTVNEDNGTVSATTGADGSFLFKDGDICTFSVGGVTLKTLDTKGLADNGIVLEENIDVAKFLQTLDNDDNPDNGILIDNAVSKILTLGEVALNGTVPTTEEELSNLVTELQEKVPSYKGQVVTEDEAQSHLNETRASVESMDGVMHTSTEDAPSSQNAGSSTATPPTTDTMDGVNREGASSLHDDITTSVGDETGSSSSSDSSLHEDITNSIGDMSSSPSSDTSSSHEDTTPSTGDKDSSSSSESSSHEEMTPSTGATDSSSSSNASNSNEGMTPSIGNTDSSSSSNGGTPSSPFNSF